MTYEIGKLAADGKIQAGWFIHVPNNVNKANAEQVAKELAALLGPNGDFDGDGLVNSQDPNPFGLTVTPLPATDVPSK